MPSQKFAEGQGHQLFLTLVSSLWKGKDPRSLQETVCSPQFDRNFMWSKHLISAISKHSLCTFIMLFEEKLLSCQLTVNCFDKGLPL